MAIKQEIARMTTVLTKDSHRAVHALISVVALLLFLYGFYRGMSACYARLYVSSMTCSKVFRKIFAPVNLLDLILINIFYATLYYIQPACFEKYRAVDADWPWKENPKHFRKYLPKGLKSYAINIVTAAVYNQLLGLFRQPSLPADDIPTFFVFILHFFFCLLLEDFLFYWGHRMLHHPYLYARVHKQHHEFYNVIHIAAINAHWFEFLKGNYIPLMAGLLVLGKKIHMVTVISFVVYRTLKTHDNHSGYEFPIDLFKFVPFATHSGYHNYHHFKNIGNYGSFLIVWDTIFRTNNHYYAQLENAK